MLKNLSVLNQRITLAAWKVVSRKWFVKRKRANPLRVWRDHWCGGWRPGRGGRDCVPRTNRGRLPGCYECSELGALVL